MSFNATQAELAAGRGVLFARLVQLHITSGTEPEEAATPFPQYLWSGFGDIEIDAITYKGDGTLISIGDIPVDQNTDAGNVEIGLSGVVSWVLQIAQNPLRIKAQPAEIYGQFFSEGLAPLDDMFLLFGGTMDIAPYKAVGVSLRSMRLMIEGENIDRNRATFSSFSDSDQQRRFAGDLGLQFIAELGHKKVQWPPP